MTSSCIALICSAVVALQLVPCWGLNQEVFLQLDSSGYKDYSMAVCALLKNFPHKYFDIMVQADENNVELLKVVDKFLTCIPKNSTFVHTLSWNNLTDKKYMTSVIFIDGYLSFLKLFPHLEKHGLKDVGKYLIVLVCEPRPDWFQVMCNIMTKMYEKNVVDIYVIIESSTGKLDFYTFYPYSQNHCERVVPERFNRFENGALVKQVKIPLRKCQNFHGCTIKVFSWLLKPFMIFEKEATLQPKTLNFTGFEGELLKTVAKKLNFTIHLETDYSYNLGKVEGENSTGPYALLHRGDIDVLIGCTTYNSDRIRYFPFSKTYYMSKFVAIVRRQSCAEEAFSWLWDPFQIEIWLLILLTFVLIILCITFCTSQQYRSLYLLFYFGQFLGVSIPNRSPHTKRSIVVQVVGFCFFILRSVYMANIYYHFSNDHIIKPPSTITDLLNQNYTIIALRQFTEPNSGRTIPSGVKNGSDYDVIFDMLEKSAIGSKTAALVTYAKLIYYGKKINPRMTFDQISEPLQILNYCGYFKRGSCLVKPFSDVVERLLNTGFMQKWISQFDVDSAAYNNFYREVVNFNQPVPLSLEKFSLVFILWASSLFVAFLVFIFEMRNRHF